MPSPEPDADLAVSMWESVRVAAPHKTSMGQSVDDPIVIDDDYCREGDALDSENESNGGVSLKKEGINNNRDVESNAGGTYRVKEELTDQSQDVINMCGFKSEGGHGDEGKTQAKLKTGDLKNNGVEAIPEALDHGCAKQDPSSPNDRKRKLAGTDGVDVKKALDTGTTFDGMKCAKPKGSLVARIKRRAWSRKRRALGKASTGQLSLHIEGGSPSKKPRVQETASSNKSPIDEVPKGSSQDGGQEDLLLSRAGKSACLEGLEREATTDGSSNHNNTDLQGATSALVDHLETIRVKRIKACAPKGTLVTARSIEIERQETSCDTSTVPHMGIEHLSSVAASQERGDQVLPVEEASTGEQNGIQIELVQESTCVNSSAPHMGSEEDRSVPVCQEGPELVIPVEEAPSGEANGIQIELVQESTCGISSTPQMDSKENASVPVSQEGPELVLPAKEASSGEANCIEIDLRETTCDKLTTPQMDSEESTSVPVSHEWPEEVLVVEEEEASDQNGTKNSLTLEEIESNQGCEGSPLKSIQRTSAVVDDNSTERNDTIRDEGDNDTEELPPSDEVEGATRTCLHWKSIMVASLAVILPLVVSNFVMNDSRVVANDLNPFASVRGLQ